MDVVGGAVVVEVVEGAAATGEVAGGDVGSVVEVAGATVEGGADVGDTGMIVFDAEAGDAATAVAVVGSRVPAAAEVAGLP